MKQSRRDCYLSASLLRKEGPPRERRANLTIRLAEIDLRLEREVRPVDRNRSTGSLRITEGGPEDRSRPVNWTLRSRRIGESL